MTTTQIDREVQAIIDQYDRGELSGLDFAIAVSSYAAAESLPIRQRVKEILRKEAERYDDQR